MAVLQSKKKWGKGAYLFFTFFTSLICTVFISALIFSLTLFRKDYMLTVSQKTDYATTLTKTINESIVDLGRGSNIPAEVLKNSVPTSFVKENSTSYINGIYSDQSFVLKGTSLLEQSMAKRLEAYADKADHPLTKETRQYMNNFQKKALTLVEQHLHIPLLLTYGKKIMSYRNMLYIALTGLGGVFFLCLLLLYYLTTSPFSHRIFRTYGYVTVSSGLMLFCLPAFLYFSSLVKRLSIPSQAMYHFLTAYVNGFLLYFMFFGIGLIGIGLFFYIVSEQKRKKVIHAFHHKMK